MREIRMSGSMSGEGKRSDAEWPTLPRRSSTLLKIICPKGLGLQVSKRRAAPFFYVEEYR